VALAAELFVFGWRAWGLPEDPDLIGRAFLTAHGVLALATVVTVWTGVEYALAARRALKA
jgi:CDP-diacylglycerol--glycerol-3-phosphate 3-phosphatidyltransferase